MTRRGDPADEVILAFGGFVVGLVVGLILASTVVCDRAQARAWIAVRTVEAARPYLAVRVPDADPTDAGDR